MNGVDRVYDTITNRELYTTSDEPISVNYLLSIYKRMKVHNVLTGVVDRDKDFSPIDKECLVLAKLCNIKFVNYPF